MPADRIPLISNKKHQKGTAKAVLFYWPKNEMSHVSRETEKQLEVRSGGRGAQLKKRPNTPFILIIFIPIESCFTGNNVLKGYYSADFYF